MNDKFKEFIDMYLLSGTTNLGLAIVVATMALVPIVSLVFLAASNSRDTRQHRLELMELCLETNQSFEDCKFMVYGGLRVTERAQPEAKE